jgi:hypothetical protein
MLRDEAPESEGSRGTPPEFHDPYTTIAAEMEAELLGQALEAPCEFAA